MAGWAVAFCHPNCERKAVTHAERQGFQCYLPRIKTYKFQDGRKIEREEPLFPRYLFVSVGEIWRSLASTTGIASILLNGDKPALLRETVIEGIKKQCDDQGLFVGFRRGQRVRVERGAMAGQIGIYQGMRGRDRCAVLLNLLGSEIKVTMRAGDLAAA